MSSQPNFSTYFTKYVVSLTGFVLAAWILPYAHSNYDSFVNSLLRSSQRDTDRVACRWSFRLFFAFFGVDALVSAIQLQTEGNDNPVSDPQSLAVDILTVFVGGAYCLVTYWMMAIEKPEDGRPLQEDALQTAARQKSQQSVFYFACFYSVAGAIVCVIWPSFYTSQGLLALPLLTNVGILAKRYSKNPEDRSWCCLFYSGYVLYSLGLLVSLCVTYSQMPKALSPDAAYHISIIVCLLLMYFGADRFLKRDHYDTVLAEEECPMASSNTKKAPLLEQACTTEDHVAVVEGKMSHVHTV